MIGVAGAALTAWYKADVLWSIWKVARGRANSSERAVALEGIEHGGATAVLVLGHVAGTMRGRGDEEGAQRIDGLRDDARYLYDHGDVSPRHMV